VPQPLFILCPGRSFSSVVCAIIGEHPECYGLPELNLFLGETLGEAADAYQRSGRSGLVGLLRTLAELHSGVQTEDTVEEAQAWIERNRRLKPAQVLGHIQEIVGPRILVEKSPSNVINDATLARVLTAYPEASYLQLLRHPRSRGNSHLAAMSKSVRHRLFGSAIDYEAKWTDTHLRIQRAADALPPGAFLRLRGEDVLRDLHAYLPQICEWLGISDAPAAIERMLHPEASPFSRPGPRNAAAGTNTGFLENPALDFERLAAMTEPTLEAPMEWAPGRRFGEQTRKLAHRYGYV
jgi:hypothetical protein